MEYVIQRGNEIAECLSLYVVAQTMATVDLTSSGYISIHDIPSKTRAYMERFLIDASLGELRITDENGRLKTLEDVKNLISFFHNGKDNFGREWNHIMWDIHTFLPMLRKWGATYGFSFEFPDHFGEVSKIYEGDVLCVGRKFDEAMTRPPVDATLEQAAKWLTLETGFKWTARDVLRNLYKLAEPSICPNISEELTGASYLVPRGTVFGSYSGNPKTDGFFRSLHKVHKMNPFTRKSLALSKSYAKALLKDGTVEVDIVLRSDDGIYVAVEPVGKTISLSIDMVRICEDRLIGIRQISLEKESILMPLENAYIFSGGSLFSSSHDENECTTWHALNDTAFEHGWMPDEIDYLFSIVNSSVPRSDLLLLDKFRSRPLDNWYEKYKKIILEDDSALFDGDFSEEDFSDADDDSNCGIDGYHDAEDGLSTEEDLTVTERLATSLSNICEKSEVSVRTIHKNKPERQDAPLTHEIKKAQSLSENPFSIAQVWNQLTILAEQKYGALIGFSSDGCQYRGTIYQERQEPDVITRRSVRERLKRLSKRK